MPKPAYRKAIPQTGVWVLIMVLSFAGMACTVPLINFLDGKLWGGWLFCIFIAPFALALIAGAVLGKRLQRGRRERVAARISALGFQCDLAPSESDRSALLSSLSHIRAALDLVDNRASVEWIAHRDSEEGRTLLFEYESWTGSGRTLQLHVRTVLAVPASVAGIGEGPGFTAVRFLWGQRRQTRQHEWKDARFADLAKEWSLFNSVETGVQFLKPAVQAELAHSPKGEWWYIGCGSACCVFRDYLDADDMIVFLQRAQRIMDLSTAPA